MTEAATAAPTFKGMMPLEAAGLRLLAAIETLAEAQSATPGDVTSVLLSDAEKYRLRLRFALGRVEELKSAAASESGVFTPARLDVAVSILESHAQTAATFIERTLRSRRAAVRRNVHVAVDDAVALVQEMAKAA